METLTHKPQRPDSDDEVDASTYSKHNTTFRDFSMMSQETKRNQSRHCRLFLIQKQIDRYTNVCKEVKKSNLTGRNNTENANGKSLENNNVL